MAIKGKKKPKARSGRVVTAGPRPAYVPPKVPLFQRTGTKFLVALIAEALIFALLVGFGEQSRADRQRAQIGEFTTLVEASLSGAGELIQPLPTGAQVLPELPTRLGDLQAGGADPEMLMEEAESWADAMDGAATNILEVQVEYEVLDTDQRLALAAARDLLERGLQMFSGLAEQLAVAAQIEGEPQEDLIASMQDQLTVAGATFQAGYGQLQEVRRKAGLPTVANVPGGGFPQMPGGIPGAPPGLDLPIPGEDTQVVPAPPPGGGGGGQGGGGGGGNG
jgi:hypothetical protein